MIKKYIFILVFVYILMFTSCGKNEKEENVTSKATTTITTPETTVTTTVPDTTITTTTCETTTTTVPDVTTTKATTKSEVVPMLIFDNKYVSAMASEYSISESYKISDVPYINQYSVGLNTWCEIVATTMVLNYYGINITAENACNFLDIANEPVWIDNQLFGPDPSLSFVGNPHINGGYGCFAPAIVNAANRIITNYNSTISVQDITNCDSDELFYQVSQGHPVLVWATGKMKTPTLTDTWIIRETGESFTFVAGEHCLVLTGYDENNVYLNCSMYGQVAYNKETFLLRWRQMGSQAVLIS